MKKNKIDHSTQQTDSKSNKITTEKKRKKPQKEPAKPHPKQPTEPTSPDENHDPTRPLPGGNEPEKIDPTRIVESPQTDITMMMNCFQPDFNYHKNKWNNF
ncbi:MAG: hypothetical protein A2033_19640 [Bacteroidetes bacterium GWA2_31_9]|nr:MAG: hypothetical protein A2033_19640 [Bacteroidetes bacterium GWA2_31_9]